MCKATAVDLAAAVIVAIGCGPHRFGRGKKLSEDGPCCGAFFNRGILDCLCDWKRRFVSALRFFLDQVFRIIQVRMT